MPSIITQVDPEIDPEHGPGNESEGALGYDFIDEQTRKQLELMDELQLLGVSKYVDLPQLVVVGDQSTGKSSVLQAVTGLPFAVDDGLCTRFATEIVLRRTASESTTVDISIIPSVDAPPERKKALSEWKPKDIPADGYLTKSIMQSIFLQAEEAIFGKGSRRERHTSKVTLRRKDDDDFDPFDSPSGSFMSIPRSPSEPSPGGLFANFANQRNPQNTPTRRQGALPARGSASATSTSPRTDTASSRLSRSILQITRSGPSETNFAVVDVPGLVRGDENNEEHKTARDLVKGYLDNPKSIVVVVIDIVDIERQEIFQMLKNMPNEDSRVIGVVNKCDTKQKSSHDWVFDLIRNNPHTSPKYLRAGWFGLRNRVPSEQDVSDESRDQTEQQFFVGDEWNHMDQSKLGRHHLKKALVQMRNQHLNQTIPILAAEIAKKLAKCKEDIAKLGPPRLTNQAQYAHVNNIAMKYSEKVRSGLKGHYNDLSDTNSFVRTAILKDLDNLKDSLAESGPATAFSVASADFQAIMKEGAQRADWGKCILDIEVYKWILGHVREYRATADRRKANPEVEGMLWREQIKKWITAAEEAFQKVIITVLSARKAILNEVCPDDERIIKNLLAWLEPDHIKAIDNATDELENLWEDELDGKMFTLQDRKTELALSYRLERIDCVKQGYISGGRIADHEVANELAINGLYCDTEVACVLDLHDSLRAYYEVALGRFIDNFATQVVERHFLGPKGTLRRFNPDYVTATLYGPENADLLDSLVGEAPGVTIRRNELKTEHESLEQAMLKVKRFMV